MRVLFHFYVSAELHAAGNLQSFRVCYFLAKAGARVHVHLATRAVSTRRELLDYFGFEELDTLEITFHRHGYGLGTSNRVVKLWGALFHLRRLASLLLTAEKRRYDVFLARGFRFPALHVFLKRLLGYRVVFEIHEITSFHDHVEGDPISRPPLIDFEGYAFRNADGIISISRSLLEVATRRWGEPDRAIVIHSGGMRPAATPPAPARAPRHAYYVGNVYPLSGVEHAVAAVAELEGATLTIVGDRGPGDPNHDRLARLVEALGAGDRITFSGFVPPVRLARIYREADVLIAPYVHTVRTARFASPLKIFEYMHARRPIIASDLPTIREILKDGESALLVAPGRADGIREALRRLMQDPMLARSLAEKAYADGAAYSLERRCEATRAFLEDVVRGGEVGGTPSRNGE